MAAAPTNDIDLDGLIQSLPACKRCRDCRRGCDTLLPKCRQCTKAGVECVFYDHGRNELLRRSYIAELVDHLRALAPPSNQPSPATLAASHASPATVVGSRASPADLPTVSPGVDDVPAGSHPFAAPAAPRPESVLTEQPHFDHHFAHAAGDYRYLGSEACLIKSPKRAPVVMIQTPPEDDDEEWSLSWSAESPAKRYELVQVYLKVLHPLFPIVDTTSRFLVLDVPNDLTDPEKYLLNMIYSIGCHVFSGKQSTTTHKYKQQRESIKYHYFAATFFERAMEHLEAATMDTSIATLRAVLLFAINSLFDTKSGNIGQQIALAMRLVLNLEARVESQEVSLEDASMVRAMHSTIFSIENEIASALDRPATFPEPDTALCFDPDKPGDFLCSLYRLQHRYRKGDTSVKDMLPAFDEHALLNPGLRMVIHQTHLLINPCWGSAWHVLEGVVAWTSIHIFLTPHWVYRAGCQLIQYMPEIFGGDLIQLYSNALVVLELSARKWPSSASLSASLAEVMLHLKTKLRPSWSGHLDLGDVKI